MSNSQNRVFGYDLIKTIAIFMIVFYHLGGLDYGSIVLDKYYLPNFNKFLLSFCSASVPLFLMVHGALILPKQLSLKDSLLKAVQILLIFFFCKIVLQYLLLERVFSIEEKMVHFWFLETIAMVYLFSFFLNRSKLLRALSLIFLFVYPFVSNLAMDIILLIRPDTHFKLLRHDGFFTLYALVYFYLGYYIKDWNIHSMYSFLMIILGLVLINFEVIVLSNHYQILFDGVNSSFPTIGAMSLSAGFYFLFKDTAISRGYLRRAVTFIGRNTLGIYLFHVLVIFLLRKYMHCDSLNAVSSAIITSSIIFLIAAFSDSIKLLFHKILLLNFH